jgi:predicted MFS family arabinose efflux permease
MRIGIISLVAAYVLSQFYRAFLAVLTPALSTDLGATPEDLASASGLWFLIFAAMQIPVGAALDSIGPRKTAAGLFALGGAGGAAVFALAQTPGNISLAMALIGIGCSPVLMASYFIFARVYPAAVFATLAGATIGFGSLGNIVSSAPTASAVEAFGWRGTMWGLAALTLAVALLVWLTVRDPEKVVSEHRGSVLDLLKIPAIWPILAMMLVNYAPAAGLRGLWAGPYARDVFGADAGLIGSVTLVMGIAMVIGNFAYGPLDRLFKTRKWVIFTGNLMGAVAILALYAVADLNIWISAALLAVIGAAGASFPMIIAHGRAFFPPQMTGRGVTLLNLFGIGGAGVMQMITGRIFTAASDGAATPAAPYQALFAFFGVLVLCGLAAYLFAKDRTD